MADSGVRAMSEAERRRKATQAWRKLPENSKRNMSLESKRCAKALKEEGFKVAYPRQSYVDFTQNQLDAQERFKDYAKSRKIDRRSLPQSRAAAIAAGKNSYAIGDKIRYIPKKSRGSLKMQEKQEEEI